jgi:hypothetical protein
MGKTPKFSKFPNFNISIANKIPTYQQILNWRKEGDFSKNSTEK